MMKKILPLSIVFLVFILILLFVIQSVMNRTTKKPDDSTMPTPLLVNQRSSRGTTSSSTSQSNSVVQIEKQDFKKKLPISTPDFSLDYAERLDKYVVHLQTDDAETAYAEWLNANPSYANELNETNTIIARQSIKELNDALDYADKNKLSPAQMAKRDTQIFVQMINSLLSLPQAILNSTGNTAPSEPTPTQVAPTPKEQTKKKNTSPTTSSGKGYVYYSQCSGPYDSIPLPNGCTVCDAGCGPTSISMILASYIDPSLTPPKVINMLDKSGVRMGCYGSYISELYSYLEGRDDLKVSDFIIPNEKGLQAKDVADDFRGYVKNGWTIFVLANFKTNGGGHYFWVTDVSDAGEILAYDPYYGKQQPAPFNENKYNPAPYYRYAFAVKKV